VTRLALEAIDLRFEALNAVELGLMAEDLEVDGLVVARPIVDHADERVLASEPFTGLPLTSPRARPDPHRTIAAVTALTVESALIRGVFWADPAPEHLLALADGRVALVGCGTVGHLSPELRYAGILFLKSVATGDAAGQVEAMQRAGAVQPDADPEGLLADLRSAEALQVTAILSGGQAGLLTGLNEAVRLVLAHRLRPPLEVILLLRTVFALGHLANRLVPEGGGLMVALLPLFSRLPELIARAEAATDR
jgi:predicted unusual protein kinase regulating ubiquinone biosynthesis (AarF/ABC1/UbiB family)